MIAVGWSQPHSETVPSRPISMHDIIEEVARENKLTVPQLLARRRHRYLVYARQYAMWRCSKETRASLPEIGRAFGGFDHTSVLHAIRQYEKRAQEALAT